ARNLRDAREAERELTTYLKKEDRIKAVTLCFCDIEGRLHMLDYDKDFLLGALGNLTFDGSSIRGFSELHESDLRLVVDWTSLTHLPSDVFGPGKVAVFANVADRDLKPYESDFRGRLQRYAAEIKEKDGLEAYMAPEIEGFLLDGIDAEQTFTTAEGFRLITTGGYFHSLPLDKLRRFIDATAEAQRAMGFRNEKDHPEVAPSQFEINFSYTDIVRACDQVLLYKLTCRQIAHSMGMTATFLPKPIQGLNGNGMHTNFSLAKNGKNIFYDKNGKDRLSEPAWSFIEKLLNRASEISLVLNSSVNAYRRLDPNFEAPNQIKVSANDRGSMIRVPFGNEHTARIEIRSVAPDANPYLLLYAILKTGLEDRPPKSSDKRQRLRFLPGNINDAIRIFRTSDWTSKVMGEAAKEKYIEYKQASASRNPRELGTSIKDSEIIYHHEVANQYLWNRF
ncbi:MAG TPA: glutamine synthetase family protein, partial [Candidatus Saccharimonadales bacterium]|nr:glutamine synthetase family protein [Candidatus Saccharimonadales bacterium]